MSRNERHPWKNGGDLFADSSRACYLWADGLEWSCLGCAPAVGGCPYLQIGEAKVEREDLIDYAAS